MAIKSDKYVEPERAVASRKCFIPVKPVAPHTKQAGKFVMIGLARKCLEPRFGNLLQLPCDQSKEFTFLLRLDPILNEPAKLS